MIPVLFETARVAPHGRSIHGDCRPQERRVASGICLRKEHGLAGEGAFGEPSVRSESNCAPRARRLSGRERVRGSVASLSGLRHSSQPRFRPGAYRASKSLLDAGVDGGTRTFDDGLGQGLDCLHGRQTRRVFEGGMQRNAGSREQKGAAAPARLDGGPTWTPSLLRVGGWSRLQPGAAETESEDHHGNPERRGRRASLHGAAPSCRGTGSSAASSITAMDFRGWGLEHIRSMGPSRHTRFELSRSPLEQPLGSIWAHRWGWSRFPSAHRSAFGGAHPVRHVVAASAFAVLGEVAGLWGKWTELGRPIAGPLERKEEFRCRIH